MSETSPPDARLMEKVIVLIDRSNLEYSFCNCRDSSERLDYIRMVNYLVNRRLKKQVRLYYSEYNQSDVSDEEMENFVKRRDFYNFLANQGFWLLEAARPKKTDDFCIVEKGLDSLITKDIERIASQNRADTIILVSGDGNCTNSIIEAQDRYFTKVEVAFFRAHTSSDLIVNASRFVDLTAYKDFFTRSGANRD